MPDTRIERVESNDPSSVARQGMAEVRRRKSPAKLAEIIHDGLGPVHTATSSKKRKAHTATDRLKEQVTEAQEQLEDVKLAISNYDAILHGHGMLTSDESGSPGDETVEAIRAVITKGQ